MLFHSITVLLNYRTKTLYYLSCTHQIGKFISKYEHNKIGFDLSINVLSDDEPIFTCFAEKRNLSPMKKFCTNAINKI